MKIAVVGIGGIGGYYGGLLAKKYSGSKDVEIVFVARGRHLDEIKARGLQFVKVFKIQQASILSFKMLIWNTIRMNTIYCLNLF